ncbi:MAG: hypothetical protein GWM98_12305 [Nitrospinaceae bacterium]|nr:hypothetical protein [Nitrospinaceae bacterium]NIR55133.1 hypothetical protein [Nitrospinaceae bacterium]NIS85553.1 hypothetical protein [Nitrospinaceae bacterium]NIT82387.1 hypothetical protein [Nitrospinaceae bacterium]NIU44600.1 hypothetical protein [Nitrospinaceae bacterium]
MSEKTLIIAILSLLGIGFIAVLFVAVPWLFERGWSNWEENLIDDGLILMAIIFFVYGFYMNTRMH